MNHFRSSDSALTEIRRIVESAVKDLKQLLDILVINNGADSSNLVELFRVFIADRTQNSDRFYQSVLDYVISRPGVLQSDSPSIKIVDGNRERSNKFATVPIVDPPEISSFCFDQDKEKNENAMAITRSQPRSTFHISGHGWQQLAVPLLSALHHSRKFVATQDWNAGKNEVIARSVVLRINELKKSGMWSLRQRVKFREPPRTRTHHDYLLEEAKWLSMDFHEERRWRLSAAKMIADEACEYVLLKSRELRKCISSKLKRKSCERDERNIKATSTKRTFHPPDDRDEKNVHVDPAEFGFATLNKYLDVRPSILESHAFRSSLHEEVYNSIKEHHLHHFVPSERPNDQGFFAGRASSFREVAENESPQDISVTPEASGTLGVVAAQWSIEEESLLLRALLTFGRNWTAIASHMWENSTILRHSAAIKTADDCRTKFAQIGGLAGARSRLRELSTFRAGRMAYKAKVLRHFAQFDLVHRAVTKREGSKVKEMNGAKNTSIAPHESHQQTLQDFGVVRASRSTPMEISNLVSERLRAQQLARYQQDRMQSSGYPTKVANKLLESQRFQ